MNIFLKGMLVCAMVFLCASPAFSADAKAPSPPPAATRTTEEALFEEIPVVYSPGKKKEPVSQASAATYVLTSKDIEMYGGMNTYDPLRQVPGMVFHTGTVAQPDVAIRGLDEYLTNNTLLLLDGRNLYLPMQGFFLWETITIPNDEIKQIEVVYGPVASLYGANAMNGLINIIEKKPEDINGTYFTEQSNFLDVYTASSFMHGRKMGKVGYKVSAQWKDYEYFYNESYRDNLGKFNAEVDYYLAADTTLAVSGGGVIGRIPLQGAQGAVYTGNQDLGYIYSMIDLTKGNFNSKTFWNHLVSDYTPQALTAKAMIDTIENENKYSFTLFNDSHSCIVGGGVRYDRARCGLWGGDVDVRDQFLFNLYMQDDWKIMEHLRLVSSGRWDYHTLAGNNFTGRVAALYSITDNQLIRASIGNAFRAPSLSEYFVNQAVRADGATLVHATGTPDLKVERVVTGELGYEGYFLERKLKVGANTFCSYYKNFIDSLQTGVESFVPVIVRTGYTNRGSATTEGLETTAEYKMVDWMKAFANYSYQLIQFEGLSFTRSTPRNKFNLGALIDMKNKVFISGYLHYVGSSFNGDADAQNFKLPEYCTVNGRIAYQWTKHILVGVSVQNALLEKHLETAEPGEEIGRRVLAELRYTF